MLLVGSVQAWDRLRNKNLGDAALEAQTVLPRPVLPRRSVAAGLGAAFATPLGGSSGARAQGAPIRIGVISDQAGPYRGTGGPGSVAGARLAVRDFGGTVLGRPIEVLVGDHQNKPDIGVAIARRWLDADGVHAIADGGSSAVAVAIQELARERERVFLITGSTSTAFTGPQCSPTGFQWMTDTYSTASAPVRAELDRGRTTFFQMTVDYAYGHDLDKYSTATIEGKGGKVLGRTVFPLGTSDFSSALLLAQNSRAEVIVFNGSGSDVTNAMKQAQEFGITQKQTLTLTSLIISDLEGMGLETAQGITWTTSFYWDRNEACRQWTARFLQLHQQTPTRLHAGTYSAVLHYLKAIKGANTDDGPAVAARMRAAPVADVLFDGATIREDGRVMLDQYLMRVKSPQESQGPRDLAAVLATIPAAQAYRPMSEGGCPLVQGKKT